MLNVAREFFIPAGREASRFAVDSDMQQVVDFMRGTPFASLGATPEGVCIEVPFDAAGSALVELRTTERHSWLGHGLVVATSLPLNASESDLDHTAALLQVRQLQTVDGGGQFGAWGVRDNSGRKYVTWSRFVPNALYRPGLALDIAMGEVNRAGWVDRMLFPHLPPRNAWDVLETRYRHAAE
jgi:hypothetical protein